jgi:hypothetical protein
LFLARKITNLRTYRFSIALGTSFFYKTPLYSLLFKDVIAILQSNLPVK